MKTFKQYLIESQQTYDFKVKIAGDCPEDCDNKIKEALTQFGANSCVQKMRTPIQETHVDFPECKNVSVTVFEVSLDYPATSAQIRSQVSTILGINESNIRVRNPLEEQETEINHQYDEKSGTALLNEPYEKSNNQNLVGEKRKMDLLRELSKNRVTPKQYKGVNDKILAKKMPSEKKSKIDSTTNSKSPLGSGQIKLPDPGA